MQLLRSLFPALGGTRAQIFDEESLGRQFYPDVINPFTIQLSRGQDTALWAWFRFDFRTHDLRNVRISGPFVHDRLDKFEKEVNEHPEWSDEEVVSRVKAAGAKFGPHDQEEFLRALPLKKLEPITGRLEVVDSDFSVRNRAGQQPVAAIGWIVKAKCYSEDGKFEWDTVLLFEPFEGALRDYSISSARRPTPAKP
jgi:hypothetical protein